MVSLIFPKRSKEGPFDPLPFRTQRKDGGKHGHHRDCFHADIIAQMRGTAPSTLYFVGDSNFWGGSDQIIVSPDTHQLPPKYDIMYADSSLTTSIFLILMATSAMIWCSFEMWNNTIARSHQSMRLWFDALLKCETIPSVNNYYRHVLWFDALLKCETMWRRKRRSRQSCDLMLFWNVKQYTGQYL